MDYGQIIHRTFDDSYVITKNSMSYHVPNEGEFAEEWAEVRAYAEAHPECVVVEQPYVPPVRGWYSCVMSSLSLGDAQRSYP